MSAGAGVAVVFGLLGFVAGAGVIWLMYIHAVLELDLAKARINDTPPQGPQETRDLLGDTSD